MDWLQEFGQTILQELTKLPKQYGLVLSGLIPIGVYRQLHPLEDHTGAGMGEKEDLSPFMSIPKTRSFG